jgi:hypothetical protein
VAYAAGWPGDRFLVLHGRQNRRPQHHWQWQLVEALRGWKGILNTLAITYGDRLSIN